MIDEHINEKLNEEKQNMNKVQPKQTFYNVT